MRTSVIALAGLGTLALAAGHGRADPPVVGEVKRFEADRALSCVAVSPDGRLVLAGGSKAVRLWDLKTGKLLHALGQFRTPVWSVAFSADGRFALAGAGGNDPDVPGPPGVPLPPIDNFIHLFDLETGKEVRRFEGHTEPVKAVAFSADGGRVLSGSQDRTIRVWDAKTGKQLSEVQPEDTHHINAFAFRPDGRQAVVATSVGVIKVWDLDAGKQVRQFKSPGNGQVWSLGLSPDGKQIATGSGYHDTRTARITYIDPTVRLWDLGAGKLLREFAGHQTNVMAVGFTPDGRRIVSGSAGWGQFRRPSRFHKEVATDDSIRVWDATTGTELRRYTGHAGMIYGLAVTPDGRTAVSAGNDQAVRVWELPK